AASARYFSLQPAAATGTYTLSLHDALPIYGGQFNGGIGIIGTPAGIVITHQETTDQLIVNGGAGNDTIDASAVVAGAMALTLNGGTANDTIIGSAGNDTFVWNPGDGTDAGEGRTG